ncbi:interleukin-2 receptor subunit beta [Danio aesculapii]|uniref:interleukin-2 receptor subunit beta n=1 Tax=Danio aesculapii TaxID=1142201 RepID=UPI0024C091BE|nr:interleukin-2 receptor subunit beta [Danio aesculapii]
MKDYWRSLLFIFIILCGTCQSRNSQTGDLTCVNDYMTNISCVWWNCSNFSNQRCELEGIWGIINEVSQSKSSGCELIPQNNPSNSSRSCFLILENANFFFINKIWLSVRCNGSLITRLHYQPGRHIKTQPPDKPVVNGSNVSWSKGSNFPKSIKKHEFQLQFKDAHTSWEMAKPGQLSQENYTLLNHDLLTVGEVYQARVRVKPVEPKNDGQFRGEWSDWSPAVSWRSEIGKLPVKPAEDGGAKSPKSDNLPVIMIIGINVLLGLIIIPIIIYKVKKSSQPLKPMQHVPDPSKYFQPLHTIHGGNFRKWLGGQNSVGLFLTPQSSDDISPVEVSDMWDVSLMDTDAQMSTSMLVHAGQVDSGVENSGTSKASSSSGFYNMGYFYSKSHTGSLYLESCPVYFSYHPDEGTSSSLSSSSSSFHSLGSPSSLPEQPMSPDSGFAMSDEQHCKDDGDGEEMEGAVKTVAEGKALVSFIMSLSQGGVQPAEGFPPVPVLTAWSELAKAPSCASLCEPAEGAALRPSSMIEPSGSGYLTLKEMQKYSNKSI